MSLDHTRILMTFRLFTATIMAVNGRAMGWNCKLTAVERKSVRKISLSSIKLACVLKGVF